MLTATEGEAKFEKLTLQTENSAQHGKKQVFVYKNNQPSTYKAFFLESLPVVNRQRNYGSMRGMWRTRRYL